MRFHSWWMRYVFHGSIENDRSHFHSPLHFVLEQETFVSKNWVSFLSLLFVWIFSISHRLEASTKKLFCDRHHALIHFFNKKIIKITKNATWWKIFHVVHWVKLQWITCIFPLARDGSMLEKHELVGIVQSFQQTLWRTLHFPW